MQNISQDLAEYLFNRNFTIPGEGVLNAEGAVSGARVKELIARTIEESISHGYTLGNSRGFSNGRISAFEQAWLETERVEISSYLDTSHGARKKLLDKLKDLHTKQKNYLVF
jgi:hypothetical protein